MKTKLIALFLAVGTIFTACNQEDSDNCLEQDTSASFSIDGTAYAVTINPVWDNDGIFNSLGFRHDVAGNTPHVVTIIFEGAETGTYSLAGQLDPHRALYFGPASNNQSFFSDPNQPGTLTITEIDTANGCLSGNYSFTANFLQISGEFESLRPQ